MVKKIALSFAMLGLFSAPSLADEDFSQYNNNELMKMKTDARNWNEEKRDAYRSERQNRMKSMSMEERQEMKGSDKGAKMEQRMKNTDKGNGEINRMQKRDGTGGGYGRGSGMGGGRGR